MACCFDEDEARRMHSAGMSDRRIGEKLNVSTSTIYRWRAENGISAAVKAQALLDWEQARALHSAGMSDGKIAEALGTSKENVRHWRKRSGLEPNGTRGGLRGVTTGPRIRIDEEAARRLYEQGRNDTEIGKMLGVSAYAAERWRQRNGLKSTYVRAGKPYRERRKSDKCYKCRYGTTVENMEVACLYILYTGERRPCPAGEGCTVYQRYKGQQREMTE